MTKNILIVHYNTPYMTECLVRSINMFVKNAIIYIFDNSDKLPFTAEFKNVIVIDNTKGQIIDFDKWLEKYPETAISSAKMNHYASAKHCYTIQKCIELLDENFLLLDSDVLLKRDVSNLFDEKEIAIAATETWKSRPRIIPYICFINVDKCKKYGIRYFDDQHIHGLTKKGDRYDTGAFFHEEITNKKLKFKRINLSEYVVYYKAASWVEDAKKYHGYKTISCDEWLERNKKYWYKKGMVNGDKVVYTCITGSYDRLIEPKKVTLGFDYVCFTDNMDLTSTTWDIRPLPEETNGLSQVKKQRYVKINAHKVLPEYKLSIWVDGNVDITGDLNKFVNSVEVSGTSVYVPQHPQRNCTYEEADAVIKMRKDKAENVKPQMDRYKDEGFPSNYGLLQSNIMLRMHNEEDCIRLMETWSDELMNNSHRDQLSFNYAAWKNEDVSIVYLDKYIYKSEWFKWKSGHVRNRLIPARHKPNILGTDAQERRLKNKEMFNQLIASRKAMNSAMYDSFNQY